MRHSVLAALMAATMLAPATATAQEEGRHGRYQAERAMRAQEQPQPQRAPRGDFGGGNDRHAFAERAQQQVRAEAQVQPQPQVQRAERGGRGGFGGRGDFGQARQQQQSAPVAPPQQSAPVAPQQQARPDRFRGGGDGGRGYRGGYNGNGGIVPQDFRRDEARRNDERRDGRAYERNGQRGYDNRGLNGYNGGNGAWSRDWRRDNRFNYSGYRNENRNAFRLPRYYAPFGWNYGYRRFTIGFSLSSILYDQNYWIDDPFYYRLPPAYGPYRWVRYYNDALLVDLRTGYVVDTVYDIFF